MFKQLFTGFLLLICLASASGQNPQAKWISTMENQSVTNTWLAYRKSFELKNKPGKALAQIAVDSKYWLWINGEPVIFEGGLKRGPNPTDTYFDEIDLAPYLKTGQNNVSILVWYFGKDGFSHKNSGRAGLFFNCRTTELYLLSDKTWRCGVLKAYQTAGAPYPNFRLSESSILYDARLDIGKWYDNDYKEQRLPEAIEIGEAGSYPWNNLIKRPIPFFKNFGLKNYVKTTTIPGTEVDTIVCTLPYNAQITPYLKIDAPAGKRIVMFLDNYSIYNGGTDNIRAEYITKAGVQEYESLGWMNGHTMFYVVPKGIKILELSFRETGYNTDFAGSFKCSDPFFNTLWKKANRTLYITMRDSYMDCPERERAQWTGDAANESGEAFYALDTNSHALTKKWLYELMDWQRKDSSIYSPVPAGNWTSELPDQSAASVGYFGLWNYYLHTGDKKTLQDLYDKAKQYSEIWTLNEKGLINFRKGDWTWGDWGDNRDLLAQFNLWYYLMVKGLHHSAVALGKPEDANRFQKIMTTFKLAYNKHFWTGTAYRDPAYTEKTDDRVQALAVVAGIADKEKYPAILQVFKAEEHASPYMEKYIFEAMFIMGYEKEALMRHQKRFSSMVNNSYFTTLFEGWGVGKEGFGGGTVNHAWSGGGLTVLSQYLCGIAPAEPAYKTISILPQPGNIKTAEATVASVAGTIKSSYTSETNKFILNAGLPKNTTGIIGVPPDNYQTILLNGKPVWKKGNYLNSKYSATGNIATKSNHITFNVPAGSWKLEAIK